jgi:DNA topoisomerase-1
LKEREYVKITDKKFFPTEIGIIVTDKLQEFFSSIINVNYTANMETELDEIAENKLVWYEVLDKFYKDFEPLVNTAFKNMEKATPEETGEACPDCGSPLVYRKGKFGQFIACSNYPECKYIKKEEKKIVEICDCPECSGKIVEKKTKKGKIFYGCNNYPKCKYALWDKPTGEKCSKCNGLLVEKKKSIYCPKCDKSE